MTPTKQPKTAEETAKEIIELPVVNGKAKRIKQVADLIITYSAEKDLLIENQGKRIGELEEALKSVLIVCESAIKYDFDVYYKDAVKTSIDIATNALKTNNP